MSETAMVRPNIERRVTPWVVVEGRQDWAESGIAAYRVWQEFDGRHWYQMHELEFSHGNRERCKTGWINGVRAWLPHAVRETTDAE